MARVELEKVVKRYGDVTAVDGVDLEVREGEFLSLLGPSGCGKTTTLRMIAGFINPTSGVIRIQGENVLGLPPEKRDIGIVFQNYAIFPHMNVFENISFGLRMRKVPRDEIEKRVKRALQQVGLAGYENRYQRELSGGEQQRVALARVLVTEPRILLLDEPLSALDRKLRDEMRFWIKDLQRQFQITSIYVTHDQGEAMIVSDRIAVMNRGRIEQVGTPQEIYERPRTRFVADFIGEANIFSARVVGLDQDYASLEVGGFHLLAPKREGISVGDAVSVVVRPERVLVGPEATGERINRLNGTVKNVTYEGATIRYQVVLSDGTVVTAELPNRPDRQMLLAGDEVDIGWHPESGTILVD